MESRPTRCECPPFKGNLHKRAVLHQYLSVRNSNLNVESRTVAQLCSYTPWVRDCTSRTVSKLHERGQIRGAKWYIRNESCNGSVWSRILLGLTVWSQHSIDQPKSGGSFDVFFLHRVNYHQSLCCALYMWSNILVDSTRDCITHSSLRVPPVVQESTSAKIRPLKWNFAPVRASTLKWCFDNVY